MNAKLFSISLLTAGVLLASASQANASGYNFTVLGGGWSSAVGINDSGQVIGNIADHATIWNGTTPTDLGTLGGSFSMATAINNSGQVVGFSFLDDGAWQAFIWDGTTPIQLHRLEVRNTQAWGINDSGQVVGGSSDSPSRATIWNGTTPTALGTLGGGYSWASGINDSGQVVGASTTFGDFTLRATIWNGTTPTDLGSLGGDNSAANGINNSGQVVGISNLVDHRYNYHATIWDTALHTMTDLGTLGGGFSSATGINDSGQVVGYSTLDDFGDSHAAYHATIWNGTTLTDLNDFLSVSAVNAGWELINANGINDNGWIVGNAHNLGTGLSYAYLLTPCDICPINQVFEPPPIAPAVPEPETYAMFMAGLGLMGFIARRRKNGQA